MSTEGGGGVGGGGKKLLAYGLLFAAWGMFGLTCFVVGLL